MQSFNLTVICSAMPGFIRCISAALAGKIRQFECYSIPEAGQMVHMHDSDFIVVDLRRSGRKQCDRIWALLQNAQQCRCIAVVHAEELSTSDVPIELSNRVQIVEQQSVDTDLTSVSLAVAAAMDTTLEFVDEMNTNPARKDPVFSDVTALAQYSHSNTDDRTPSGIQTPATPESDAPIAVRYRTETPELYQMLDRLQVAAQHDVTILLIGETGCGKTHLARLIHEASLRESEPLVTVACGALPGELIESELFGHVRGAFTSAHADKDGKFLAVGRGTVLLDEIDVLPPEQQVKLLRVIETGQFEAVGSNRTLHMEARIIAASNLELQPLVEQGRFRPDLYYRLNTLTFRIPPLRRRLPDIEPLTKYFVDSHARRHGIDSLQISRDFLRSLLNYPWPGNVREMENAIRSAVIYNKNGELIAASLPPHIVAGTAGPANDPSVAECFSETAEATLENRIELTEKDIIEQALLENSFNRTRTARELGISRVTLYNKMKKYGMMQAR
ncbi:MAG: sigma-54 dependent transcriptional regulator [Fuerstiella sp.]|nr:sigma-54 dependent transcriptional regulator [Fuerstiella sp.]